MKFQIESEIPDHKKIPNQDEIVGLTAIILSVFYKEKEFFRCGYYVYNNYTDE